jgi:hypothetical protein
LIRLRLGRTDALRQRPPAAEKNRMIKVGIGWAPELDGHDRIELRDLARSLPKFVPREMAQP